LIRASIAEMAQDGELSSIYFRWFLDPNNDSVAVFYVESARQHVATGHVPFGIANKGKVTP